MSKIDSAAATGLPSRRRLLVGAAALAVGTAAGTSAALAAGGGDAELLRLRAEYDRRVGAYLALNEALAPVIDAAHEAVDEAVARTGAMPPWKEYQEIYGRAGWEAHEKAAAAAEEVDEIVDRMGKIPASSVAALAAKIHVMPWNVLEAEKFAQRDWSEDDMDWDVLCLHRLGQDADRLAGGVA